MSRHSPKEIERIKRIAVKMDFGTGEAKAHSLHRVVRPPCPNCKETVEQCACMRNKCRECGQSVGNITFTYCDKCWGDYDNVHAKRAA